jgi:hypothetical protein
VFVALALGVLALIFGATELLQLFT